jgi:hypothetical protein
MHGCLDDVQRSDTLHSVKKWYINRNRSRLFPLPALPPPELGVKAVDSYGDNEPTRRSTTCLSSSLRRSTCHPATRSAPAPPRPRSRSSAPISIERSQRTDEGHPNAGDGGAATAERPPTRADDALAGGPSSSASSIGKA